MEDWRRMKLKVRDKTYLVDKGQTAGCKKV